MRARSDGVRVRWLLSLRLLVFAARSCPKFSAFHDDCFFFEDVAVRALLSATVLWEHVVGMYTMCFNETRVNKKK